MANTYDVVPADVAAELPGLFPAPGGFTSTSAPTSGQVQSFISTADTVVTLRITDNVAQTPSLSDKAAAIAKLYIINAVIARVLRLMYVGREPASVAALAGPYEQNAKDLLASIDLLGEQAIGTGESSPSVAGHMTSRPLLLESSDLGDCRRGRF